ncbi:YjgN family protein [Paracoccus fistulariae]|uniref:DUF898 domain-containing protein n=1 Tax=Paracoccus fistulariae TaxID=658446 RepID=A0ABY7SIG4_9RHOB|nr:YjgN family protein [Paracoccus fistulariae]MDB6181968.1 YjgN family protein [Paracoccus fistulariae]WCR06796.1 DUF898 domain-containing protein [Paracoccus fistulariae]
MEPTTEQHQIRFTGDAKTYFGIWIVNILLSIVTLGIYSAWAKVRTQRYFNQNTLIDDRRFDYHATGKQLLIGRLLVVLFLILTAVPVLGAVLLLGLIVALPWLINRSLAFHARMTSFSGVRFGFDGSYGRAFLVFMLYPLLSVLTLFLFTPFLSRASHRYVLNNARYGTARFGFDSPIGPFYAAFLLSALTGVALACIAFIALGGVGMYQQFMLAVQYGATPQAGSEMIILVLYASLFIGLLPAGFIYQAFLRNAVYSNITLQGGHRFVSTVKPLHMVWIAMSNAVLSVISLGLLYPWAKVRMARYLADSTQVKVAGSFDVFVGIEEGKVTSVGDAYTDIEGIDLGLAV